MKRKPFTLSPSFWEIVPSRRLRFSGSQWRKMTAEQRSDWKAATDALKAGVKRNRFTTERAAETAFAKLVASGANAADYYVTEAMEFSL